MARAAAALRAVAHGVYADEPVVQERCPDRVFEKLQMEQIVRIKIEAVCLDSTSIKVHPDGTGALKKTDPRPSARAEADGTPRFIWLPQMLGRP